MKVSRSASGSVESVSRISPTASARRILRRISWRSFLPSVARKPSKSMPGREVDDRADVLALDVERPALDDLAAPERDGECVGGRVAAPEAAEVDDVPRIGMRVVRRGLPRRGSSTTASETAGRTSGSARTVA